MLLVMILASVLFKWLFSHISVFSEMVLFKSFNFASDKQSSRLYDLCKHYSSDPAKGEGEDSGGGDLQVDDTAKYNLEVE